MKIKLLLIFIFIGLIQPSLMAVNTPAPIKVEEVKKKKPIKQRIQNLFKPDRIQTERLVVLGFIFSLVSILIFFLAPVSFILCLLGLRRVNKSKGAKKGKGLAIVGMIFSGLYLAIAAVAVFSLVWNFFKFQ